MSDLTFMVQDTSDTRGGGGRPCTGHWETPVSASTKRQWVSLPVLSCRVRDGQGPGRRRAKETPARSVEKTRWLIQLKLCSQVNSKRLRVDPALNPRGHREPTVPHTRVRCGLARRSPGGKGGEGRR